MPTRISANNVPDGMPPEIVQFEEELSPAAARALLKLTVSPRAKARMHELSAKARAGTLSSDEEVEINSYEHLGCLMDILHSKARQTLRKRRTAS